LSAAFFASFQPACENGSPSCSENAKRVAFSCAGSSVRTGPRKDSEIDAIVVCGPGSTLTFTSFMPAPVVRTSVRTTGEK
jgi:hypothetical protein